MKLHYKKMGSGHPLIVLHGLMGMLDNWQYPAKFLAEDFELFLLDQRNHGHSEHSDDFSYSLMADDLLDFFDEHKLYGAYVLGHSMGGKTSMKFAQHHPDLLEKLIVVDIAPRAYPVHHQLILQALKAVPLHTISRRTEAEEIMRQYIKEEGVIQFLLKNLFWKDKGQLDWRFNLSSIEKNIEKMGDEIADRMFEKPTLFIRGEKSDYIKNEDLEQIHTLFPDVKIETISGAGHWVHADKTEEFVEVVRKFLR